MVHVYLRAPILALAVGVSLLVATTANAENQNEKSAIGTNLSAIKSWSPSWTFIDIAPRLRPWASGGPISYDVCNSGKSDASLCQDGDELVTDAYGWPVRVKSNSAGTVKPRSVLFDGVSGNYPSGEYLVMWEGTGTVRFTGSVYPTKTLSGTGTEAEPFRGVFTVPANKTLAIQLIIDDIGASAGNTIKNLRILVPGGVRGTVNSSGQITDLNPFSYCTDLPRRSNGVSALQEGSQCIDFEHVTYNRFEKNSDGSDSSPATAVMQRKLVFHPKLLKQLRKYRTLRFMDLLETNSSPVVRWEDRAKVKDQSFTTHAGIPPEYCIAFSNVLDAEPWFTMPHKANNDYNRRFAQLVDAQIANDHKIYLEYSNETWNSVFSQNAWIRQQGAARDLPGDQYLRGTRYHSERTVEIANVWKSALGSRSDKLKVVIASQAYNPYVSEQRMAWGNTASVVDYLAIAPYFARYFGDPKNETLVANMSVTSVFEEIMNGGVLDSAPAGGSMVDTRKAIERTGAIASKYNVSMIAYEGGQHMAGFAGTQDNDRITNLFIKANGDPRMQTAYTRYLNDWKAAGGELFVHYLHLSAWSKWGSWGALRTQVENTAKSPKFQALMNFIDEEPCWWQDCVSSNGSSGVGADLVTDTASGTNSDSGSDADLADDGAPVVADDSTTQADEVTSEVTGEVTGEVVEVAAGEEGSDTTDVGAEQENTSVDSGSGDESSEAVTQTPQIPRNLTARGHKKLIKLKWQTSDSRNVVFTVYRANKAGDYQQIARTRTTYYVDKDVSKGTIYRYVVRASRADMHSYLSRPASAVRDGSRHRIAQMKTFFSSRNRSIGSWRGTSQLRIVNHNGKPIKNAELKASWWKRSADGKLKRLKTVSSKSNRRGVVVVETSDLKAKRGEKIKLKIDRIRHGKSLFDRRASDLGHWISVN